MQKAWLDESQTGIQECWEYQQPQIHDTTPMTERKELKTSKTLLMTVKEGSEKPNF